MKISRSFRTTILDFIIITIGSAVYALAFDIFLDPNNISPGGASGLAMVINRHLPVLSIGVMVIIINAPLFIFGFRIEGRRFLLKSLYGTLASSVLIDLFSGVYQYNDEPLLAAVYGGVLMGAGLGLVFSRGATTGGSDIAARLLTHAFPNLSVGRLMLAVDACIIALAAITFRHINYALYAVITVYISTTVMDSILYGVDSAKVAYIMTSRTSEVVEAIFRELDRGATLLNAEGGYSGESMKVVFCAIKRRQTADLKRIVHAVDPRSFVIITDAHEVLGEGFLSPGKKG